MYYKYIYIQVKFNLQPINDTGSFLHCLISPVIKVKQRLIATMLQF